MEIIISPRSIDPIYATTTIIHTLGNGELKNKATGFFFKNANDELYLVTNKHVIYGERYFENPEVEIDQIKLRLHINPSNLTQNDDVIINLFEEDRRTWLEHRNSDIDVILIPLIFEENKYTFTITNESSIDASNIEIGFEKLLVMGYPYGWYDEGNNLPIIRIGHLSSPFKIPFQNNPFMLGDVETHPGMSGGPVFIMLKDYTTLENGGRITNMGASKTILAGIHSGQPRWDLIDHTTGELTESVRHSLVIIWFSDLILEIISDPKPVA